MCGPRALVASLLVQYGVEASYEEIVSIARSDELVTHEHQFNGDNPRSTYNNYYADHLSFILKKWCQRSDKNADQRETYALGWLTVTGKITVFSDEEATPSPNIVWIYSDFDADMLDEHYNHYQGLGRQHLVQVMPEVAVRFGAQTRKRCKSFCLL